MIDLKQLQEDSFASAFRRYPKTNSDAVRSKIHEELDELDFAHYMESAGGKMTSNHCPELTAVEEELADIILACLVFAKCENIDIEKALRIKNEFNKVRK